jgi:Xaa-Pro aminopeptidase
MVPGESFQSVASRAAQQVRSTMPEFFALMHSIGIEQYDHPQISGAFGGGDLVLEPGMTVNFETGYQELGWGVIHLEDTYLITENEPERLTTLPLEPL